ELRSQAVTHMKGHGYLGGNEKSAPARPALRMSSAAWDASAAAWTLSSLIDLLGQEAEESDQAALLKTAIGAIQQFITAETAEVGTPEDAAESMAETLAWLSVERAVREGRRKSEGDLGHIQSIHD